MNDFLQLVNVNNNDNEKHFPNLLDDPESKSRRLKNVDDDLEHSLICDALHVNECVNAYSLPISNLPDIDCKCAFFFN